MPFRFNHKDLAILACSSTAKFNKEGLLWFKEKEGKLFNKTESFSERLVRLYGNLLFYFKGKDVGSECSGVIVLEKYKVVPDSSLKEFGFFIEFHVEDEQRYEFAADHKEDYDDWVALLKRSSLEKLAKRLQLLRTEIQSFTEEDPFPDYHPIISLDNLKMVSNRMSLFTHHGYGDDVNDEGHLTEICIGCCNLKASEESLPCAMVQVFTVVPPSTEWMKHSQTEICEKSKDPIFLRTIVFASTIPSITRIKFVVHHILDKINSHTVMIGQVVCTMHAIQKAPNWKISYNIANVDGKLCGTLNIFGWKRRGSSLSMSCINESSLDMKDGSSQNTQSILGSFTDQQKRRFFHIPTRDGSNLKFQDILAESTLCFKIPKLLLGLFIQEEKDGVVELHNIGDLHPQWDIVKEGVQNSHIDHIQQYSTNLADLCQFEGLNIKKSVQKATKEFDFIPTNLHLQQLAVIESDEKEYLYNVVTVGAPAAHSLKFKQGGLRRLHSTCDEYAKKALQSDGGEDMRKAKYIKSLDIKENLKSYNREILHLLSIVKNEINNPVQLTEKSATEVSMKIGELLNVISTSFIKDCEKELLKARIHGPELRIRAMVITSGIDDASYKDLNWEWTGCEYKAVKLPSMQYDCQVRDTLGRFMAAVNHAFISKKTENKDDLLILLDKLEKSVKSLIGKINVMMRFIMMQNQQIDSPVNGLRYRSDIVFSQTLTPVVAGFAMFLSKKITDMKVMEQITNIGLLVHFESLLTTAGDEMGMLEDMYGGLIMLKTVKFEIVGSEGTHPTLCGTRDNLIVVFHVHQKLFKTLPKKLRERGTIKIHPVLFSMGINEQATVAERFGDTSLQETINNESLQYLQIYIDALKHFDPKFSGSISTNAVSLDRLMSQLHLTVNTRKNKNYDILLLTEEICMRVNGLRMTSCKSAKDRSSMAVTLEMVNILKREHGLREDAFQRVLDSVRSQGTRLINSYKNVGIPKYAFNKVQVKALPSLYRPPEGTIGKYIRT